MTYQAHQPILDLMQDGQPRTSYEICDALYGPQPNGRRWYAVAGACDRLVAMHRLVSPGKREHRTVYQIAPRLTTGV